MVEERLRTFGLWQQVTDSTYQNISSTANFLNEMKLPQHQYFKEILIRCLKNISVKTAGL